MKGLAMVFTVALLVASAATAGQVKMPAPRDVANKPEAVAAIDVTEDKKPAAPALSVEQKQAVQILVQKIEISQLKAQAAQAEFDKARTEITALVQTLQKEGYDLDLQTLTYKKTEPKK